MLLLLRIKTLETSFTSALVSSHTFCRLSKLEYLLLNSSKFINYCKDYLIPNLCLQRFLQPQNCMYLLQSFKFLCPKLVNFAFRFHAQICVCKHFIMQRFPQMFSNFQVLLFIIRIL